MKFTKGTDPRAVNLLKFVVDDSIACPQFLPLDDDDSKITLTTLQAAIHQQDVPMSEHIRKEAFYRCF